MSTRDVAHEYREMGLAPIPLFRDSKKPLREWKQYQTRLPTVWEIGRGFTEDCNIGIVTGEVSGIVVLDADSEEGAKWILKNCGDSPVRVRTPRGLHNYFAHPKKPVRNKVKIGGNLVDVRGDGGYVVAPPSSVEGRMYEWLGAFTRDLPVFQIEWLPEDRPTIPLRRTDGDIFVKIERARRYVGQILSKSGEGGHNSALRAACKLREFGLPIESAWPLLLEWNETNAFPPWSLDDLKHKIEDAYRKG